MFSDYDRLMATLASHDVYLAVIGQFGYNLATFWVTYTGADSLMVFMCLGDLLKIALGPLCFGYIMLECKQCLCLLTGES